MADEDEADLDAGDFSAWLTGAQRAIRDDAPSTVPCHGCTACCTSSQFVAIAPDELDTLAHIPAPLLFPAPRRPRGHMVLGYDQSGRCPMLVDGRCSIYEHRPRACRTYDCRVFAAAGVDPDEGGAGKAAVAVRVRRWRFSYARPDDAVRHEAVRAAAAFVAEHPDALPDAVAASNPTARAIAAVRVHAAFVGRAGIVTTPDPAAIRAAGR